jgi:hypothetical protein
MKRVTEPVYGFFPDSILTIKLTPQQLQKILPTDADIRK